MDRVSADGPGKGLRRPADGRRYGQAGATLADIDRVGDDFGTAATTSGIIDDFGNRPSPTNVASITVVTPSATATTGTTDERKRDDNAHKLKIRLHLAPLSV